MDRIIKYILFISISVLINSSCQPIELDNYKSEIVVDGWIEPGQFAQILLSKSTPYFGEVDSASLRSYSMTHAKITLSNGEMEEILTMKPNHDYFPPYIYLSTKIKGEVGKTYKITVESEGRIARAETTIPEPVRLTKVSMEKNNDSDSLGVIKINFHDPADADNYYIAFTKSKNRDSRYTRILSPTFEDFYFSGQDIDFELQKGSSSPISDNSDTYFNINDTISIKFCTIDKASFNFWMSFQKELLNTSNPFASSKSQVQSNIENGLGIWCGYGSFYYTLYPK